MGPDIEQLRQEFIEKFGSAEVFDDFYEKLCKAVLKEMENAVLYGEEIAKQLNLSLPPYKSSNSIRERIKC